MTNTGDRIGNAADEAQLRYLHAADLAQQRHYKEALAEFDAALRLDPALHTARFQLGLLQLTCANPQAAKATWAPLHAHAPESLQYFVRGLEALIEDDFAASLDHLQTGVALNSVNPALNKDMEMMMARIRAAVNAQPAQAAPADAVRTDFSLYDPDAK